MARFGCADIALAAIVFAACRAASPPPAHAPLTTGPVIALAAAHDHTCALMRDGKVACWGSSPAHELRDPTNVVLSARPTVVEGLPRVVAIATAEGRVCAIDENGSLWCWGDNVHGAILPGQPVSLQITKPARIEHVKNVRTVTTSAYQTCALEAEGRVVCWGQVEEQAGRLFVAEDDEPVELAGGRYHHCARLRHGEVTCWGAPKMSLFGDDDEGPRRAKARVSDVVRIAVWGMRTCAWLVDGSTVCWGQEGGRSTPLPEPRELDAIGFAGETQCRWTARGKVLCDGRTIASLDDIVEVVAGGNHRCALSRAGDVACWGGNQHAQLGDESRFVQARPHVVVDGHARALAMSAFGTCVALDDARTQCWGGGTSLERSLLPLDATSLLVTHRICGRAASGAVRCMDRKGRYAADVAEAGSVRSLSFDGSSLLALREDGTVAAWPTTELDWYRDPKSAKAKSMAELPPQQAKPLKGVGNIVEVSRTPNGALYVVDRTGALLRSTCQEDGSRCDLASALRSLQKLPLEHARAVATGATLGCALTDDGSVACWTENRANTAGAQDMPRRVTGLAPATAIAAGQGHACALVRDGQVACWGRGDRGEMGDGLLRPANDPTIVPGISNAVELAAAGFETCVRTSDAKVKCWGGFDSRESAKPRRVVF